MDSLAVNNSLAEGHSPAAHQILDTRFDLLRKADIPLIVADARDYHLLSRILGRFKPDCIIHLAAVAHLDRANKDPHSTFDHSLRTLENALDAARSIGTAHLIYFSSSTVYGDFEQPTVDERSPTNFKGIYGAVKLAGEHIVRAYSQTGGPEHTIIRPCALYGPRCVSGRVIQKFIETAHAGGTCHVVPGRVDFTYIDDLVDGIERCITNPAARNQTFNITAGEGRTLTDVVSILRHYYPKLHCEVAELDPQRPIRGTLSCELAHKLIGYSPRNRLETGIQRYVEWYREFRGQAVQSALSHA